MNEERNGGEWGVQGRMFYEGALKLKLSNKFLAILSLWDLISQTSNRTHIPCIGRQSLNHWATGEAWRKGVSLVDCRGRKRAGAEARRDGKKRSISTFRGQEASVSSGGGRTTAVLCK